MRQSIVVPILLMLSAGAQAQTVTECGRSDGYSYYFAGGAVPADKDGWTTDGIDDGRIILNFTNGQPDLLIKNATGSTVSVTQTGGQISVRKAIKGLIALTVFYDDTAITEDYVFQLDAAGKGTVAWTVIRTATSINKMSLMTAECHGPG